MTRIRRDALSDQVVQQIGEWILTGKFVAGEILPSEQALSDQFEVSKTVVREAMKVLSSKGLLSIRQGIGTTVSPKERWQPFDPLVLRYTQGGTNFYDLIQLRQIIEPEVAAMASKHNENQAFLQLLHDLSEKGGQVQTVEDHVHFDVSFHQALADATGNQLLVIMMNSIGQFLRASRQALFHVPGALERSVNYHREIYEAVARGDEEASRDAMKRHLVQVVSDYEALVESNHGS